MINSVKINGADMYESYGLILSRKSIEPPQPQTEYIEIPMRDGSIDISEDVAGCVKYKDRKINLKFLYLGDNLAEVASGFYAMYAGKRVKLIFSDDASYYYIGRLSHKSLTEKKHGESFDVEIVAEPFKYDIESSAVDWEWDSFDFESGIINELGQLIIAGEREITLICRRALEIPIFNASNAMQMEFDGESYNLKKGKQKLYRVLFHEGPNVLKFKGNGTLTIDYVGGSL